MSTSSDAGLRIRVDDALRHAFLYTCKAQDKTAAQVLRAFMRSYVEQFGQHRQQSDLFPDSSQPSDFATTFRDV